MGKEFENEMAEFEAMNETLQEEGDRRFDKPLNQLKEAWRTFDGSFSARQVAAFAIVASVVIIIFAVFLLVRAWG